MPAAIQHHGLLRDLQSEIVQRLQEDEMFFAPPRITVHQESLGDLESEIEKKIGCIGSGGGFVIVGRPTKQPTDPKRPFVWSVTLVVQCLEKSIINRSNSGNKVWAERLGEQVHVLLDQYQPVLPWTYLQLSTWESGEDERFKGMLAEILTFTADTIYDTAGGIPDPVVPLAPVLTGDVDEIHNVTLNWSNVANETGYEVYRSVNGATWVLMETTGADATTATETFDETNGLYYRVRAFNAVGFGPYSNILNLTPPLPPPATYTAYFGRSASTILNEAGILALTSRSQASVAGTYNIAGGASAYLFFSFPITEPAPLTIKTNVGGTLNNLPLAQLDEGYETSANGLTYHGVASVGGVAHRLYRSYYPTVAAVTIVVT